MDGTPPDFTNPYLNYSGSNANYRAVSQPLPLQAALSELPQQYMKVLTHPNPITFIQEKGKAAWNIIWLQLIAIAIIEGIVSWFTFRTNGSLVAGQITNNPAGQQHAFNMIQFYAAPSLFSILAATIIGFFVWTGISQWLARSFGGVGTYLQFAYSYMLFNAPISIIAGILSIIPGIGPVIAFAGLVYSLVLQTFMTMGVHRLNGKKAALATLLPLGVLFLLFCFCATIFGTFIATVIGGQR